MNGGQPFAQGREIAGWREADHDGWMSLDPDLNQVAERLELQLESIRYGAGQTGKLLFVRAFETDANMQIGETSQIR